MPVLADSIGNDSCWLWLYRQLSPIFLLLCSTLISTLKFKSQKLLSRLSRMLLGSRIPKLLSNKLSISWRTPVPIKSLVLEWGKESYFMGRREQAKHPWPKLVRERQEFHFFPVMRPSSDKCTLVSVQRKLDSCSKKRENAHLPSFTSMK